MSNAPLPPHPCLLAILLVAKLSSEAKLIFHYPPRPGEDNSAYDAYLKQENGEDDDVSSSTDSSASAVDDHLLADDGEPGSQKDSSSPPDLDLDEAASASPEKRGVATKRHRPRWNDICGYSAHDLAQLLTPHRSGHKKRFEVGLHENTFLGRPLFNKDGTWTKRKKRKPQSSSEMSSGVEQGDSKDLDQQSIDRSKATKLNHTKLNMFHVVFVMNPPLLEHHLRTKDMYEHVARKFSKALKWEQSRSDYIPYEASLISSTIQRYEASHGTDFLVAPMYHDILAASILARAMATLYTCISTSRIAHVTLSPDLSLSLQIPMPTSISILPSPLEPQLPGLWLTTAATLPADDDVQLSNTQMAAHFALLLLSDASTILADVKAMGSPLLGPLTHYLRASKPTKSFVQISQMSGIALPDIQFLASHLIHWRRARAIPPLNKRNTYITSPNADMGKLGSATPNFVKQFPTLPSLPKILSMLSFTPRPFHTLIPSPDHKEAYMEILAYLFQGGWVTQLRSFAWIRVPAHIRQLVDGDAKAQQAEKRNNGEDGGSAERERSLDGESHDASSNRTSTLEIPAPASPTLNAYSKSSMHAATPLNANASDSAPTIIPQPRLASSTNSRYLSAISKHVLKALGRESQEAWDRCVQYFDGEHAIGAIVVNEGWKRKKVADLLSVWEAEGLLVRGRHW